jgi:hypothetical protein
MSVFYKDSRLRWQELTEKQLEVIPEMLAFFVCGNSLMKSAEMRAPENTPLGHKLK